MFWKSWRYIIDLVVVVITWNSVCVFGLIRLRLHQQWFFLSCFPVWIISGTFYDFHAKKKKFGFDPKWNGETERKPIWKSQTQLKWFLKIIFVFVFFFRLFREWQWFFDYVFSSNRVFTFFFFFFRFGFQSAICDLLSKLYVFFLLHTNQENKTRHSIIIIAKRSFYRYRFMIICSAQLVHDGSQLWLMILVLELKMKSQCFCFCF